jgi:hypothetical protein
VCQQVPVSVSARCGSDAPVGAEVRPERKPGQLEVHRLLVGVGIVSTRPDLLHGARVAGLVATSDDHGREGRVGIASAAAEPIPEVPSVISARLSFRSIVGIPLVGGAHNPFVLALALVLLACVIQNQSISIRTFRDGFREVVGPRAQRSSEVLGLLLRVAIRVSIASSAAASGSGSRWI